MVNKRLDKKGKTRSDFTIHEKKKAISVWADILSYSKTIIQINMKFVLIINMKNIHFS